MNRNRRVVYTFIIGDYDELKAPTQLTPGWDYICFSDAADLRSNVWDVRLSRREADEQDLDNKRFAMKHMILFHRYAAGYDLSVSVGAQFRIACNLDAFLDTHFPCGADDMMICRHPVRDCVYEEAEACKLYGRDDPKRIDAHMARYRAEGYPAHRGLYSTRFIARRHGRPYLDAMCELWFKELRRGSRRDQLSLNYALWKSSPLRVAEIDSIVPSVKDAFIMHRHKHASSV